MITCAGSIFPVSYTHLDVYKRQIHSILVMLTLYVIETYLMD